MMPVLHFEEGLLIDEKKRAYALLWVDGKDYGFQSIQNKIREILNVTQGLREWIGEWFVYSLSLGLSPDEWRKKLPNHSHPIWQEHVAEADAQLQNQMPFSRAIYLVIPLEVSVRELNKNNAMQFGKRALQEFLSGAKQTLKRYLPTDDLSLNLLESWHRERKRWMDRFNSFLTVRACTPREIESWLRHGSFRGLVEPDSRLPGPLPTYVTSDGTMKPLHPASVFLQDAEIHQSTFHVTANHADGQVSYQTFFAALRVPAEIDDAYPYGHEWVYEVDNLNYPVDLALHVRVEDPRSATRKLRKKELEAQSREREYVENDEEVPLELEEELSFTSELKRNLRDRNPLVHVKMIVGIGADSEELLHRRSKQLLSDMRLVQLVRAPGDQLRFWQAFYPFASSDVQVVYETPMDPAILGAGVPFACSSFGDPSGFLLGFTYSNRAVFMNPTRPAMQMNRPPAILIAATPGGGKTSLCSNLLVMMLTWGAKGFINDPKGHDYDGLASLPFKTRFIRMEPGAEPFNPFRLGMKGAVTTLLELLFNGANETNISNYRSIIIGEAIEMVQQHTKQDMIEFGRALQAIYDHTRSEDKRQQVELLINLFRTFYSDPLGHLFFGEDTQETPADYDCTIVCTNYLTLPTHADRSNWTLHQRVSTALFYAVTAMGLGYFSSLPKTTIKFMGLDESWHLRHIPQGRDLINKLLRESRSLNIITAMLMQNATDFEKWGESITGMFSWKFLLRQDDEEETKSSLRIAGLPEEDADEWGKTFMQFESGQGLVIDPEGRLTLMQITPFPSRLLHVFDTTPREVHGVPKRGAVV